MKSNLALQATIRVALVHGAPNGHILTHVQLVKVGTRACTQPNKARVKPHETGCGILDSNWDAEPAAELNHLTRKADFFVGLCDLLNPRLSKIWQPHGQIIRRADGRRRTVAVPGAAPSTTPSTARGTQPHASSHAACDPTPDEPLDFGIAQVVLATVPDLKVDAGKPHLVQLLRKTADPQKRSREVCPCLPVADFMRPKAKLLRIATGSEVQVQSSVSEAFVPTAPLQ